jgi:1-acyl-sn-glycerol-3-phosphate acyltransferase
MDKEEETYTQNRTYSLAMGAWYRVLHVVIGFLLRILSDVQVEGLEHVPGSGPYLLVTNHLHWLDAPTIMVAFPYRAHVFAAEKWAVNPILGPLFRSLDAIFVQRGEVDRQALRRALALLRGGGVLGVAPEGTRSRTGAMQRGRSGAAFLAFSANVRVVPLVITGQEKVFPSLRRFHRGHIRVVFGPAFRPPVVEGKASSAQIHAFAEEIMYRMAAMLPPEYRGVYHDVSERRPDLVRWPAATKS